MQPPSPFFWIGKRFAAVLIVAYVLMAAWPLLIGQPLSKSEAGVITFTFLFAIPFSLGALITLFLNPDAARHRRYPVLLVPGLVCIGMIAGAMLLNEGLICIAMLTPLWFFFALGGALIVFLERRYEKKVGGQTIKSFGIAALLPLISLAGEPYFPAPAQEFTVTRHIDIEAPATEIWPHLLSMPGIAEHEGQWNLSQDVFHVPRPVSAIVEGTGPGAVRKASWQLGVSFEEHITLWQPGQQLAWDFYFPNDSISRLTDPHIPVDGGHLKVLSGGYRLEPLDGGRTRLHLRTTYRATTPANHYSALWGELFLGDIQNNILDIVRNRSEASPQR